MRVLKRQPQGVSECQVLPGLGTAICVVQIYIGYVVQIDIGDQDSRFDPCDHTRLI